MKDEYRGKFRTELSSFLAFFPIEFWQLYLERTNVYGFHLYNTAKQTAEQRGSIYGGRKWVDATLKEFMTFFGMLIEMTTCPTPGLSYPNRWNLRGHDYTKRMSLGRFKDLRSALQMSDNFSGSGTGPPPKDALYKVCPLVNVLKKTLGKYLEPGSELSLDESSIASRSKYGRSIIFYNPSKPTGKYHFRFYVMTDIDCYVPLRFQIATKDGSDTPDGLSVEAVARKVSNTSDNEDSGNDFDDNNRRFQEGSDNNEADGTTDKEVNGKLVNLILEMAKPWQNTGRVINMDNYYTSPTAFVELQKMGLFARGTCKKGRCHFPV